jgi:hypothetical protein
METSEKGEKLDVPSTHSIRESVALIHFCIALNPSPAASAVDLFIARAIYLLASSIYVTRPTSVTTFETAVALAEYCFVEEKNKEENEKVILEWQDLRRSAKCLPHSRSTSSPLPAPMRRNERGLMERKTMILMTRGPRRSSARWMEGTGKHFVGLSWAPQQESDTFLNIRLWLLLHKAPSICTFLCSPLTIYR